MVFKKYKSKNQKIRMILFWWKHNGEKKFEAGFIEGFGYIFWFWRNKQIYNDWPQSFRRYV